LAQHSAKWKIADLRGLGAESPLLSDGYSTRFKYRVERAEACPVLALPGTQAEFTSEMGPRLRKNLRRARSHFQNDGELNVTTACSATLDASLSALFTLHGARWNEKGCAGVLHDSGVQEFHQAAALGLQNAGALRLQILHRESEVAAAIYCLVGGSRTYFYIGGFSPKFQRLSPGAVLLEHAIREAIASGQREFDFLRGSEAYKYSWGARDRFTYRTVVRQQIADA
jgi:CelD/BcsL family acetyltransferase involved in cellulose biosynthesis